MKLCVSLITVFSAIIVCALRMTDLSWSLCWIGGALAFSGLGILFFGCSVQRLLSEDQGHKKIKNQR